MPTVLLFSPAKVGPFGLGTCFDISLFGRAQRVCNRIDDRVRARKNVELVEAQNPKAARIVAGNPRSTRLSGTFNFYREFFGKAHEGRVLRTDPALSNERGAELFFGEAGPKETLGKRCILSHAVGEMVAPVSPSYHGGAHLTGVARFTALAATLATISTVSLAQNPVPVAEWPGAEIAEGVAFQGDGSVTLDASADTGLPVLTFWRPVLHDEGSRYPVAGRMDCRIAASQGPFSEEDFDPAKRHKAIAAERKEQGFIDGERLASGTETVKKLDVIGRRNSPRSYFVLSYIMARDGDRLIDIRRNCTFVFGSAASKPDVLPYVNRYTKLIFAFSEQES